MADAKIEALKKAIRDMEDDDKGFWIGQILRSVFERETGIRVRETQTAH